MKTPYKKSKHDLWKLFSKYIRLRHADDDGNTICITCGKKDSWKRMQAGHYISRTYLGTLFDERNVQVQCGGCNNKTWGNGRLDEYALYLLKIYGIEILTELSILKHSKKKFKNYELQNMIEEYKDKLVGLDIKRGIL